METEEYYIQEGDWGVAKALQFSFSIPAFYRNKGWRMCLQYWWALDIWFGSIPVIKGMILANIIVWLILFGGGGCNG